MQANHFDSTILGANFRGIHRQGSTIAVGGLHRLAGLRKLANESVRGLFLRLGAWYALVLRRVPAGMTPAMATCPSSSGRRDQRRRRWMPGVVVDPGTVGDC